MLKLTWKDRLRSKIGQTLFKIIGVKSGPEMIRIRGEWLFIDTHGKLFRVTPTHDYYRWGTPLIITLERY